MQPTSAIEEIFQLFNQALEKEERKDDEEKPQEVDDDNDS